MVNTIELGTEGGWTKALGAVAALDGTGVTATRFSSREGGEGEGRDDSKTREHSDRKDASSATDSEEQRGNVWLLCSRPQRSFIYSRDSMMPKLSFTCSVTGHTDVRGVSRKYTYVTSIHRQAPDA